MLNGLRKKVGDTHLTTPRDADVWVVWQDTPGSSYGDLIKMSKKYYPKPVYVVQHGRGATRDYGPPNNYPMIGDRFLCWGTNDYERMVKFGYKDKTRIIGCPLNPQIKPMIPGKDKKVLFIPVNSEGKEHPEDINVYYELLKLKYEKAQEVLMSHKKELQDHWGLDRKNSVSFSELSYNMDVVAKLLFWHEKALYHGTVITGYQDMPKNNELIFKLLRNTDLVVSLDESTSEVFALGHDVPVIIVKGFEFRNGTPINASKGSTLVDFKDLKDAVSYALTHPEHLRKERAEVAEAELGLSYGDPVENILKVIKEDASKGFTFLR